MESVTRSRLLELADFFDELPVEKFDHNRWFAVEPDGGVSACIGGYGVLNMSTSPRVQKLRQNITELKEIRMRRAAGQRKEGDEYQEMLISNRIDMNHVDWTGECIDLFGFDSYTMTALFHENSDFWRYLPSCSAITPKEVALALRFLAYKPGHHIDYNDYFVPHRLKGYIDHVMSGGAPYMREQRWNGFDLVDPCNPFSLNSYHAYASPHYAYPISYTAEIQTTPEMRKWMDDILGVTPPPVEAIRPLPEPAPVISMEDWLGQDFVPARTVPISQPMELMAA